MTSSTDQEEASFAEVSLSCFKWSGPVVELAAGNKGERGQRGSETMALFLSVGNGSLLASADITQEY